MDASLNLNAKKVADTQAQSAESQQNIAKAPSPLFNVETAGTVASTATPSTSSGGGSFSAMA